MDRPTYDIRRLREDLALRGWMMVDLARAANLSSSTVTRFMAGSCQTAKVAQKLAHALGYQVKRYLIPAKQQVSA